MALNALEKEKTLICRNENFALTIQALSVEDVANINAIRSKLKSSKKIAFLYPKKLAELGRHIIT